MKRRIVIDHNNNKQLRHYDADGDYIRLSVDETIARGLNAWEGWLCGAGVRNLYIDYDGNVWVCNKSSAVVNRFNEPLFDDIAIDLAQKLPKKEYEIAFEEHVRTFKKTDVSVRKVFEPGSHVGLLGNIFQGFHLPTQWMICQWKQCGCGSDVFTSKAKIEHLDKLAVTYDGNDGRDATENLLVDDIEASVAVEPNFSIPYQILWDLGRRCNYDCSYCWDAVHNRDAPHKTLEDMIRTADRCINDWAGGKQIRWNFGGGEPTLNPDFLRFLEYLKNHDQWVLVTTNGSRPRSYWKRAIEYINSVNLSVHFEFVNEEKLLGNIEEICNHFDEHDDDHWLEIKLMSPPGYVARSIAFREQIEKKTTLGTNGANGRVKGVISIVPIRVENSVLANYNKEELKLIQSQ